MEPKQKRAKKMEDRPSSLPYSSSTHNGERTTRESAGNKNRNQQNWNDEDSTEPSSLTSLLATLEGLESSVAKQLKSSNKRAMYAYLYFISILFIN